MPDSRHDFEAAIGAIITRFNDVEIALIELIVCMVGDSAKGSAIGWALGFREKVAIVAALAKADSMTPALFGQLKKALEEAQRLSEKVRNQVAHAEMWENPMDESIGFRKGSTNAKRGYLAQHPDWSVAQLRSWALEIEAAAADLHAFQTYYAFEPVIDDVQSLLDHP